MARPRDCVVCKTVICGQGRFGQLNDWRLLAHVELLPGYRRSTRKARSPGQMLSKTGLLRQHAFRARIRHPVNRNGDHHRLCQGRTPRHCARDRLATAHVSSDPMDATTQPRRFK